MGSMSKSPLSVARQALAAAKRALPEYSCRFSRRDYTQHQLFALLTLKQFMKLDYRGVEVLVREWSDLRAALGLEKPPHYSTLKYAADRLFKKGASCGS